MTALTANIGARDIEIVEDTARRATGLLQSALAWMSGCIAAALTVYWAMGVLDLAGGMINAEIFLASMVQRLPQAAGLVGLIAFLTAVPVPLIVILLRETGLHRGTADMLLCAMLGAVLAQIFGLPIMAGGEGIARTGFAALSGAMGGLTYWIMAGRPN